MQHTDNPAFCFGAKVDEAIANLIEDLEGARKIGATLVSSRVGYDWWGYSDQVLLQSGGCRIFGCHVRLASFWAVRRVLLCCCSKTYTNALTGSGASFDGAPHCCS